MPDEIAFRPDRRPGLIFHSISLLLLVAAGLAGLWQAAEASISPIQLLPVLAAAVIGPILAYRIYAIRTATYTLMRDGVRLRWGLRTEQIPITDVLWVYPVAELSAPLPLPRVRFPGAVVGRKRFPGGKTIEYLATDTHNLVFIATSTGGFAVSPNDPQRFIQTYQRFIEMGSLSPAAARSVYPSYLLAQVRSNLPARILLSASIVLSLGLLTWVGLAVPAHSEVHLGFHPDGSPGDLAPSSQLMLLPLLNFFFLIIGLFAGLFFFRREDSHLVAYLLWAANVATALLFIFAVFFILGSG